MNNPTTLQPGIKVNKLQEVLSVIQPGAQVFVGEQMDIPAYVIEARISFVQKDPDTQKSYFAVNYLCSWFDKGMRCNEELRSFEIAIKPHNTEFLKIGFDQ